MDVGPLGGVGADGREQGLGGDDQEFGVVGADPEQGPEGVWVNEANLVGAFTPGLNVRNGMLAGGTSITYYAYVSPNAITAYGLTLPNGASTGVYGSAACGAFTSGVHNGWQCDANQWYRDDAGKGR